MAHKTIVIKPYVGLLLKMRVCNKLLLRKYLQILCKIGGWVRPDIQPECLLSQMYQERERGKKFELGKLNLVILLGKVLVVCLVSAEYQDGWLYKYWYNYYFELIMLVVEVR